MLKGCPGGRLLVSICAALLVAASAGAGETQQALPGLHEPVEILRDRWGISHIYARNEHDLFLAQGYSAARDRLFQLELWRRQATGTLAEIQGPRALPHDLGARLFKFRGDMEQELNHYHPRAKAIVSAFVEGINAYIELTQRNRAWLPLEFRVLGIKPGKWTAQIVVSRHNGLYRNVTNEVRYAQLVHLLGSERTRTLLNLRPGQPSLKPDPALDLSQIGDAILATYKAARAPVRFRREDVEPPFRGPASRPASPPETTTSALPPDRVSQASPEDADPEVQGSNNWVVSPEHTFTRSAILANDPHRTLQLPSLRYWTHLVAPGWNVIGGGEPALPGISIGHNQDGAWGFTIFPIDQEDLYVYQTDPANPLRYRYRGDWETMETIRETIAVKGGGAVEVNLKYTRHGPVVHEDLKQQRAYALRAAWLEVGAAPYLASLRIDQAANWTEFRDACRFFRMPAENLVWADVNGHIGWRAVGLAPHRGNWDGLLPVPGDGRYEWEGFLLFPELPEVLDPPNGWLATANQDDLPRRYPSKVSFEWTDPFRFARIDEVLGSGRRLTLTDMMQLQQDELALPARSLVPLLRPLRPGSGKASQAIDRLLSWNFVLNPDSAAAAIYVAWERALKAAVWETLVPSEARPVFPARSLSTEKLIQWLTTPDGRFGADPVAKRDALLLDSLTAALTGLEDRLGQEPDRWRYGHVRFKHVALKHPLSDAVAPQLKARLDLGPLNRGGYAQTVNNTSDDDNQSAGASFRIIADTGDWDRSVGTNTPGQSGDPESPHYRDLFEPWAAGRYFPIFFSRAEVESVTEEKLTLQPGP